MTIEKGLIGYQDLGLGTGQFQRKSQSGQLITLDQIRASHIPILDSAGRFTGTEIEAALAEVMTREESGSSVKKLTNKSGAQREAGDVVIIDTSNDNSFTTTTTEGSVLVLGVVLETIANNATGRVATGGYVASVKVTGATVRGDYLKTSTTVVKAVPSTAFVKGVFAIALFNDASVVSAYIFGALNSGSGSGLDSDKLDGLHAVSLLSVGYSVSLTFTNIAAGTTSSTQVLTHALGTDDVFVIVQSTSTFQASGLYGLFWRYASGDYNEWSPGKADSTLTIAYPTTPASGNIAFNFRNDTGVTLTVTFKLYVIKRQ